MIFLADESVEGEIVSELRYAEYSIADVKEISPGVTDEEVLALAVGRNEILITNDKDFGELIYRDRLFSLGVVLLRFGRLVLAERIEILKIVLDEHSAELPGAFTVITAVGVRIRR